MDKCLLLLPFDPPPHGDPATNIFRSPRPECSSYAKPVQNGKGTLIMASIQKRPNGKFLVQTYGGRSRDGKRIRISKVFNSHAEAVAYARQIAPTTGRGGDRQPVGDAIRAWAEARLAAGLVRPTTANAHIQVARLAGRMLGNRPVGKVTHHEAQALLNRLATDGLARNSIIAYRTALKAFFAHALLTGQVTANPFVGTIAPKAAPVRPAKAPSLEAVQALRKAAHECCLLNGQIGIAVELISRTGLRRGEACGLRWSDLVLEGPAPSLTVNRTRTPGGTMQPPKTAAGQRVIPLSETMVAMLIEHRQAQRRAVLAYGVRASRPTEGGGPVLMGRRGDYLDPNGLSTHVAKLAAAIPGWQGAPIHGLRHFFGTQLHRNGVSPVVLSQLMGHADLKLSLSLYVHSAPDLERAAIMGDFG